MLRFFFGLIVIVGATDTESHLSTGEVLVYGLVGLVIMLWGLYSVVKREEDWQ